MQKPKAKIYDVIIGKGIRGKVLRLIFVSLVILSAVFIAMSVLHSHMLSDVVSDASAKQQKAITTVSGETMNRVESQNLERSNMLEAEIADEMFDSTKNMITFLSGCVNDAYDHPEEYGKGSYSLPDPADDGKWTGKVIYADGTDPKDSALTAKLSLLANMTDLMIELCNSYGAANVYIGLPEGAHFSISDSSSSWYEDGKIKSYDPRTREWYKKAKAAGELIFTDGEWDANTGAYCIECAMPAYDDDHKLIGVIGADMYLDDMQQVMKQAAVDGEHYLFLNHKGVSVIDPQIEAFPLAEEDKGQDIRKSKNEKLADIVENVLKGRTVKVHLVELEGDLYYITARPIETTGWVLISAYDQKITGEASALLVKKLKSIQAQGAKVFQEEITVSRIVMLLFVICFMIITLWTASILGKRIVDPLNMMTEKISGLGGDDLEFKMEDAFRTGDEVEELAESFSSLSHKTVEYMNEVVTITAEKERIGAELSLATDIQGSMLPHIFPAFPHRSDIDVYASMNPAKEVGGDFYDFYFVDENHLVCTIADVSGKGVPAALFMMASKIILQSIATMGYSPKEILERTNEALCKNNEAEMFVTVWLGILDTSTGKLVAANAGHKYPVVKMPDGGFELYKDVHGFVLGAMEGMKYKEYELRLEKGSKLFLYTDGVPEATNADDELFGTERMLEALNQGKEENPEEVLNCIHKAVDAFVGDAEQFDDLTALCIEYKGND